MNFELLRVVVALLGTLILAYQDNKTSFVDEKMIYVMIAAGLLFDLLTLDTNFIAFAIGGAILIALIGYWTYTKGQFGAGDIMLFAALQLLLPFAPLELIQNLGITALTTNATYLAIANIYPFIFSILITAAVLALVGSSLMYALKTYEKKISPKPKMPLLALVLVISAAFILWFNSITPISAVQLVVFLVLTAASAFSISMKAQITREVIIQNIPIAKIEDEDVLATEVIDEKLLKKYKIERVLTKENVAKLKKLQHEKGIKLFPVYKNLPRFVPYVFLALAICLLVINPIAFILFA